MAKIVKRKIKKGAIYLFAGIVAIIVICILGVNYYNDYQYQQTEEFKLIEKGYSKEQALELLEKLPPEQIEKLLTQEKNDIILSIINEKYYLSKNLDAYLSYAQKNPEKSTYDIIALVNVHANLDWYEETYDADISKGSLLLVNKFYQLNADYTPENLVTVSNWYCYGENKITQEAYDAFVNMFNKAKESNVKLIINSSYRSYQSQEETYNQLKKTYGSKKADSQAAHPGHSEHETGLAFDIFSPGNTTTEDFENSAAYSWLKEHAHEFGFIERYPKGKEYLTGYNFESWHWRYVGVETAIKIVEEQITFDEYYAFYLENN